MSAVVTPPLNVVPEDQLHSPSFDEAMEEAISTLLARYPTTQAALLPVLWLCQEHWGWISPGVIKAVAERLELSSAFIEGVVTFYTMYQRRPPGRYLLQVCTTLSCQLCGTSDVVEHLKKRLGVEFGQTTPDGRFTLLDVQCLGACGEGPVVQINNDYYTELDAAKLDALLDRLE